MSRPTRIRRFTPSDSAALAEVFRLAIHQGAACWYTAEQRDAWSGRARESPAWQSRLGDQITVIAEQELVPVGFMTLGYDGHLDLAFVLPRVMGTGVADALHDRIVHLAQDLGMNRLDTEASHLARRFLLRQGWAEICEQQVDINGVCLTNFRMQKFLNPAVTRSSTL